MKVARKGKLWRSDDVANYLGISEIQAKKLMQNGEIFCIELENEKTLRTTKFAVKKFLKESGLK